MVLLPVENHTIRNLAYFPRDVLTTTTVFVSINGPLLSYIGMGFAENVYCFSCGGDKGS